MKINKKIIEKSVDKTIETIRYIRELQAEYSINPSEELRLRIQNLLEELW